MGTLPSARGWRVSLVRSLPRYVPEGVPKEIRFELVTDFGERVCFAEADLREAQSLPPAALDLSGLKISISLASDSCVEEDQGRVLGGKSLRVFRDRACTDEAASPSAISFDRECLCKVWARIDDAAPAPSRRPASDFRTFRLRVECYHERLGSMHPGGGPILGVRSPVFTVLASDAPVAGRSERSSEPPESSFELRKLDLGAGAAVGGGRLRALWVYELSKGQSTGCSVWDAAAELARAIARCSVGAPPEPDAAAAATAAGWAGGGRVDAWRCEIEGARVLELGAGTGLVGLAAGVLGARHVTLTGAPPPSY